MEVGVGVAHFTTAGGLSLGRTLAAHTLGVADEIFEAYGVPNGVRVVLPRRCETPALHLRG